METEPKCPKCNSENVYPDGNLWVCPECSHEWTLNAATVKAMETPSVQQRLKDIGATVVETERRSPEYLQKFVESEIEKWAVPIKASGLSMD